jgi:hypothetical protein
LNNARMPAIGTPKAPRMAKGNDASLNCGQNDQTGKKENLTSERGKDASFEPEILLPHYNMVKADVVIQAIIFFQVCEADDVASLGRDT